VRATLLFAVALLLAACGQKEPPAAQRPRERPIPETRPAQDSRPVIVAFGDSLSAGSGVPESQSYPACLQRELDRRGLAYRVENAGISGDTTSGGVVRVETVLALKPVVVILELGANDGLRGLPIATTRANLEQMIQELQRAGTQVVLAGMTLPPNYGPDYIRSFERVYTGLAAKHKLRLIPFLLEGVAGTAQFMQSDGLHPNADGNVRVAANVMKVLEPLLGRH
jgi:acyl-CoA thioesterase-1